MSIILKTLNCYDFSRR
ncbi:hypothetical protein MXB_4686 [Myxobolus squamalis]|nr:hypothetical protein MXB_4686 [Myxobolus squamalis]